MIKSKRRMTIGLSVAVLALVLVLAACGGQATPTAAPTTAPTPLPSAATEMAPAGTEMMPTETEMMPAETEMAPAETEMMPAETEEPMATEEPVADVEAEIIAEGQALFVAKGCAACHGENGEGVEDLGPALAGHSKEAVFKQVREPRPVSPPGVQMPAFGPDQISDEELEKIAAFILSLGPPTGAGPFLGSMTEAAHLRLALLSLQAEDLPDARAHLQDLVASGEGESQQKAQEILTLLEENKVHEAEHELETLLLQAEGEDLSPMQLHIVLALSALEGDNYDDAIAHLEQAIEEATGEEKAQLEALLTAVKAGEVHDVSHELEKMLGRESQEPAHP